MDLRTQESSVEALTGGVVFDIGVASGRRRHNGAVPDDGGLLTQALRRLDQQNEVLEYFEQKWIKAQNEVQLLMDSHARTKSKLARLSVRARKLYRRAIHDELTGLPNRQLLMDRLEHAIVQADRHHSKIGVVFVDLRDFKRMCDQQGADMGEQPLKQLAAGLAGCVRAGDTVSRYRRYEFVILLPAVQRAGHIEKVMKKLRACLQAGFVVGEQSIGLTADFGAAIYPSDAVEPGELVRLAEAAYHRSADAARARELTVIA
jgi:diguanylate cyclase (GGDEF)-like protein